MGSMTRVAGWWAAVLALALLVDSTHAFARTRTPRLDACSRARVRAAPLRTNEVAAIQKAEADAATLAKEIVSVF